MANDLIISISGLRGIVGQNLTATVATEYARAFGTFLKNTAPTGDQKPSVALGRDSRPTGQMLKSAVAQGLADTGVNVVDLGLVPTPTVGIMLRHLHCAGGIVITASHNPSEYNGIKLLLANGVAPPAPDAETIRQLYFSKDFALVDDSNRGCVSTNDHAHQVHIQKVLPLIDADAIAAKKFKVVLDSVNGAGGPITQTLLARLGCRVVPTNCEPTGLFAHTPEPTAQNLTALCDVVKEQKADVGFAQDPDADRLAVVDENGTYVGEEYTLVLAAKLIFAHATGAAAANLSNSRMIDDIAQAAGASVIRTPVGEANVADAMLENNCIIGGEGNGGVIDLRVGPVRDSLLAIALILQLMTETGKTISDIVAEIPRYYMLKEKFPADKTQAQKILDAAKTKFADARLNTIDGCRFDFDDAWLHLRTSNTEPVMRLIIEAKDSKTAQKYVRAVSDIRKQINT